MGEPWELADRSSASPMLEKPMAMGITLRVAVREDGKPIDLALESGPGPTASLGQREPSATRSIVSRSVAGDVSRVQ